MIFSFRHNQQHNRRGTGHLCPGVLPEKVAPEKVVPEKVAPDKILCHHVPII